jgi:hypothetical protein
MRLINISRMLVVAVVALGMFATGALAQSADGAFSKLSPGQQKIAQALFEAQTRSTAPNAPAPLTLDQIAAKKQGHDGWGQVFKEMKSAGLLTDKNLGQVVKSYEAKHPESAKVDKADKTKPEKMEKPDKPQKVEKFEKPEKPERGRN